MSNPPEDIMVSTQLPPAVRRIKSSNNLIKLRKQFEKTDEKITIPTLNQTDAKKTTPHRSVLSLQSRKRSLFLAKSRTYSRSPPCICGRYFTDSIARFYGAYELDSIPCARLNQQRIRLFLLHQQVIFQFYEYFASS